jgi:hypothetical protein
VRRDKKERAVFAASGDRGLTDEAQYDREADHDSDERYQVKSEAIVGFDEDRDT